MRSIRNIIFFNLLYNFISAGPFLQDLYKQYLVDYKDSAFRSLYTFNTFVLNYN